MSCRHCGSVGSLCPRLVCQLDYPWRSDTGEIAYWQANAREAYAWAFQSMENPVAAIHYQKIGAQSSAEARRLLNLPT